MLKNPIFAPPTQFVAIFVKVTISPTLNLVEGVGFGVEIAGL
ncbi:hypothetical protein RV12_GL002115 [Enterococcus quebecensis]|nr:hypothetical protein RV12_GL002115 [Enterococcus quebecensis]